MYSTSDFRKGLKIEIDGKPFQMVEFLHVKPGKGGAFVRTKLKNMINGRVIDQTFRSGEKVGRPDIEEKEMQYLYKDGDTYCMMDNETYEQIFLTEEQIEDCRSFLLENTVVKMLTHNGEPIAIELPNFVTLTVTQSEPGLKGDTATGATKPATLETGHTLGVPLFVNEGDKIKVDTRTGEYVERAN
ncbi:MAG: elongation factor P [Desulfobacterales bacterium C00003106]|jgi:elongation factor P|nr:MAG: elongation factor P [Desulfobacterales bacterium C00003106]OEU59442.1 MAG: elongation factor P [Desulfobacterales bacterium C00003104]